MMGGPVAGAVAGPRGRRLRRRRSSVDLHLEPEPHRAVAARSALAGAWRAWTGRDRRWWLAGRSRCRAHDAVPRPRHRAAARSSRCPTCSMRRRRPLGRVHLGVLAIFAVAYLPLLVNELTTGGSELRAALEYLAAGGAGKRDGDPRAFRDRGAPGAELAVDRAHHGWLPGWRGRRAPRHRDRDLAITRERPGSAGRPLAWSRTPLVDGVPHGHRTEPGHGRSRAAQRSLPRVRGPDGLHAGRTRRGGARCGRSDPERAHRLAARSVRSWPASAWSPCWAGT